METRSAPYRARQSPVNPERAENLADEPRQSATVALFLQVPALTVALIVAIYSRSDGYRLGGDRD